MPHIDDINAEHELLKKVYFFLENDTLSPNDCDECTNLRGDAECSWHKNLGKITAEIKRLKIVE